MKKTIAIIAMLLSVTAAFAQVNGINPKWATSLDGVKLMLNDKWQLKDTVKSCDTIRIHDTIHVRDTVTMPVYLVDVTDTVPATVMYKKSEKSDRVYTTNGYALIRGFKTWLQSKMQWVDKPNIIGALDEKKKPLKNLIQVL